MSVYGAGRRKGQMLVLFAFSLILLCCICVLAIDIGRLFVCKAQLQNAVDAASVAGASQLTGVVGQAVKDQARQEAEAVAKANLVANTPLTLAEDDVVFGHHDSDTGEFIPESEGDVVDSIRVSGRRAKGAPDGPIDTFFGGLFGLNQAEFDSVVGVGTKPRRYVMFALDRSGSMCFDTAGVETKSHYQDSDDPHMAKSPSGWYWLPNRALKKVGYGWKSRTAWFIAKDDDTGEVRTDFLPEHIRARLDANRYFNFRYRGDSNTVRSGWIKVPGDVTIYGRWGNPWHNWSAEAYFDVVPSQCGYAIAHSPVQPIQSTMDAACAFVDLLRVQDDQAGVVTYGSTAILDSSLTTDFGQLKDTLQSFVPGGATAEPAALTLALNQLVDSDATEGYGQKIMVLMTDGNANHYNGSSYDDDQQYNYDFMGKTVTTRIHPTVGGAMEQQTQRARENGVKIYTVSFGEGADKQLHERIAQETNGAFYYSENHENLTDVFVDIFRRLPPVITY